MEVAIKQILIINNLDVDDIESDNFISNYHDWNVFNNNQDLFNTWIMMSSTEELIEKLEYETTKNFPILANLINSENIIGRNEKNVKVDTIVQLINNRELIGYRIYTTQYFI